MIFPCNELFHVLAGRQVMAINYCFKISIYGSGRILIYPKTMYFKDKVTILQLFQNETAELCTFSVRKK